MKTLLLITCLIAAAAAEYSNHKVFRVTPENAHQLDLLRKFENEKNIDFWSRARAINAPIDVMVGPTMIGQFTHVMEHNSIPYSQLIDNLETVVQQERLNQMLAPRMAKGRISFDRYHRYDDIIDYLNELAATYPNLASVHHPGKSSEGRDIAMLKISTGGTGKPSILIDGTIHAREWISPATVLYFIHQLVENDANRHMVENVDWYIIPMLNPDGYEYTHTRERFWRKTRTPGSVCDGVDGNRNFDYHWMEVGASANECSEIYAGPRAFSESETRALQHVFDFDANIKLYLTFHSYGNYLLYPWGWTSALPDDWETLDALAHDVADAIYAVDHTRYTIGSSTNVLYAAAGGSDDWVKAIGGVALSYTIELPGGGSSGFDPPPSAIRGVAEETWEGMKVYHAYVEKNY